MVTLIQSTAFLVFAFSLMIVSMDVALRQHFPDWLAAAVLVALFTSGSTFFITTLITIWT
jgi:hypothetical protein